MWEEDYAFICSPELLNNHLTVTDSLETKIIVYPYILKQYLSATKINAT